jgi:hypothetical protein
MISLIFNQATTIIRDMDLIFAKYPQYLTSFDDWNLALCIRITHLLAFFNVSRIIFILKYMLLLTHEKLNKNLLTFLDKQIRPLIALSLNSPKST